MMALTSFAVLAYGRKYRANAEEAPSRRVTAASLLGGLGLLLVFFLSIGNLPELVGSNLAAVIWGVALIGVFMGGCFLPGRVGAKKPAV